MLHSLNTYHMSMFAKFVETLKNTPDGKTASRPLARLLRKRDEQCQRPQSLRCLVAVGGSAGKGHRPSSCPTTHRSGTCGSASPIRWVSSETFGESWPVNLLG